MTLLLSTYNGASFLKEQLDSLCSQTYNEIKIIARDDGSHDSSVDILKSYDIELIRSNENVGAKESFSLLLEYALEHTKSDYFMFCDQDDVWNEEKVEKTYEKMLALENNYIGSPVLIYTDLEIVNENLGTISPSFFEYESLSPEYKSLNRLLLQNTITGCTMMLNRKLAELVSPIPKDAIMHDWWIALVASKFGKMGYIHESLIKYRQHDKNSIGAKEVSCASIFMKFYKLFFKNEHYLKHEYASLVQAKEFLELFREKLDEETIKMLQEFISLESKSFWEKRKILLKYKLLKQGLLRNFGLLWKI